MDNTDKEQYIREILRRIRSGEERTYSMEEAAVMLGIDLSDIGESNED